MKIKLLSGMALGLALIVPAAARANDPDVKKIIKDADDATKEVKAVAYSAEFFGTGDAADRTPHIKGSVKLKKPKSSMLNNMVSGGSSPPMHVKGAVQRPGSDEEHSFEIATDGKTVYVLDEEHKTLTKGELSEARQSPMLRASQALLMLEYAHPTPFSDELNGDKQTYEGSKKIGDAECDVIYIVYSKGQGKARWYFAKEDHLPRRVDRIARAPASDKDEDDDDAKGKPKESASVTMITKLEIDPEFKKGAFRIKAPEGYKEKDFDADNEQEEEPQLLTVGKPAPEFDLQTPDGKTVSLKSLRGNVVVLDFWATWCGPCKLAMPGVQKIHEQFKDKPVKVFGVNCWERGGDPAKFMKDKKYSYGLLLKGDKVADKYKVAGIPTFYVIDPQGKIVFAGGFKPGASEKELAKAIEKALNKGDM